MMMVLVDFELLIYSSKRTSLFSRENYAKYISACSVKIIGDGTFNDDDVVGISV